MHGAFNFATLKLAKPVVLAPLTTCTYTKLLVVCCFSDDDDDDGSSKLSTTN
jgi:hypothetical protein